MAMVNMNNLLNGKDSRWLQLEVCREFQRNKCSRPDTECKFAHPPANVEVQNGRVTACYDSIKGRCNREKPPCKYFHPPQHLKDQLLINGRNHLALKNALMQQMGLTPGQPLVPGQVQAVEVDSTVDSLPLTFFPNFSMSIDEQYAVMAANPYLTGMPQVGSTYSPYFAPGPIMPTIMGPDPTGVGSPLGVVPQTVVAQQKMPRSDRLEVCREYQRGACKRAESECRFAHPADSVTANEDGTVTVCMDAVKGRCNRDPCRYFHPPLHLQAQIKAAQSRASAPAAVSPLLAPPQATAALEIGKKRPREPSTADTDLLLMDMKSVGSFYYDNFAFPAMMPYKRPAADKSGVPVYQPNATTYQQLMQLQQPFVPVSCEYSASPAPVPPTSCASPAAPQQQDTSTSTSVSQSVKENELSSPISSTATSAPSTTLPPLPLPQPAAIPDPAALAKEVAQQNYAKAVKLAAVSQSLAAGQLNQLNPLNYTGVALNKQALTVPPPALARYPTAALPFGLGTAGLNLGLANPYSMAQQNLMNLSRPPPAVINPYSIIRTPYPAVSSAQLLGGSILGAQYPVTVSAAPITNVSASANIAAAAAQNNNNVVIQPYKKLKTT
ncbi:muscleblind-like protein 2a isoform X1 [Zophobas morio]|uniref:muscleblind-like protein 2a isoform X1 n=1 Tax=Zophobas morio TaxID=2755281 RepID=UPI003082C2DA